MPATAAARRTASARSPRASSARAAPARPRPARAAPGRAPTRTAPRRAPVRQRRSQVTPIPGRLVAVGVGRTAGAVGGIADSGLVVRLTRGRLWIGLLATLLVGIVALNVVALGLSASSSKVAQQSDGLRRANSALRARIAGTLASDNVESAAASIGLVVPEPGSIRYLTAHPGDAARAAQRLRSGELGAGVPPTTVATTTPVVPTAPAAPADAAPVTAPATDPVTTETAPPASDTVTAPPATDAGSGGTDGGGLAAPTP